MEERKPWDRKIDQNEPIKWYARFDRFRLMKPWKRSVNAVFLDEQKTRKDEKRREEAPGSWYQKAKEWRWDERADDWDKCQIKERDRLIKLEEDEVLNSDLALKHNRIKELKELSESLKEEVYNENKRWIEDVKAVGKEAYYIKQFNDAIIREYRATFDDIAKEKGERVKLTKAELTGKDGGPIETSGIAVYLPQKDEAK